MIRDGKQIEAYDSKPNGRGKESNSGKDRCIAVVCHRHHVTGCQARAGTPNHPLTLPAKATDSCFREERNTRLETTRVIVG